MATASTETKQPKPLPAPNSDFYDVRSTLSPEEQDIVRQVREFADAKVAPVISKYWLEDAFPFELLPEFKKLNIGGVAIEGALPVLLAAASRLEPLDTKRARETYLEALSVAVTKLSWTQGPEARRIMFLVGDAPPHMDYAQDTKYPEVLRMARERGIIVNAVQAGAALDTERVWRSIAQLGNGRYLPIPQDGGDVLVVETPFDREIFELQKELNGTVIPYGSRTERAKVTDKVRQVETAPAPVANEFSTFMAKRKAQGASGRAVTGEGDLVADIADGRQRIDAVKEEQLSDELRKLPAPERKAAIEKQVAQRGAINGRMRELVTRRDAFVAAERTKQPAKASSSDRAVAETLSSQVKR